MKLPAVVICIDHVANFREKTNNRYDEDLIQISREGVGYGIYLMLSSAGFGMERYRIVWEIIFET